MSILTSDHGACHQAAHINLFQLMGQLGSHCKQTVPGFKRNCAKATSLRVQLLRSHIPNQPNQFQKVKRGGFGTILTPESIQVSGKHAQMMRLCVESLLHMYTLFGPKLVWELSTHVDLEVKQRKCITEEEGAGNKQDRGNRTVFAGARPTRRCSLCSVAQQAHSLLQVNMSVN